MGALWGPEPALHLSENRGGSLEDQMRSLKGPSSLAPLKSLLIPWLSQAWVYPSSPLLAYPVPPFPTSLA